MVSAFFFHSIHKTHGKFEHPMLKGIHTLSKQQKPTGSPTLPIEQVKTPTPLVDQQVKTFVLHDTKIK